MQVDEQRIVSLSQELWASQLGLSIRSAHEHPEAPGERTWSSCIKVSGPWQGAIVLECPESIVRHAAATFFEADGEQPSEDDIHDALKELADMVGRKMRPLLPEDSKLSRPSIGVDAVAGAKTLAGMHGLSDLTLDCEGRPVRIALYEGEPEAAAAAG
jgi:hypothetical protein